MQDWNATEVNQLIDELSTLRSDLVQMEEACAGALAAVAQSHAASARNLLHYLALRRHDLRGLQERLAALGLSSLGRAEACVLASLDAILRLLGQVTGRSTAAAAPAAMGLAEGQSLLEQHTELLLGMKPAHRSVRIMVTMPSEAAHDAGLIRDLVAGGMDCMRINCAHDDPDAWGRMIEHLRRAEAEVGQPCRVLMDLPGPKLRTGPVEQGPQVIKFRPQRDDLGRVITPARIWLTTLGGPILPAPAAASIPVPADWLAGLTVGDRVKFRDARGRKRLLRIVERIKENCWAEAGQTAYVTPGVRLHISRSGKMGRSAKGRDAEVGPLPPMETHLVLHPGDTLQLTAAMKPGRPRRGQKPARIACTLPEVFTDLRPGQRILFDDGKIGGIIREVAPPHATIEITQAAPAGTKLGADKGINLPDTALGLPALTPQDLADLPFIAAHADLIGYSFVRQADDIAALQARLVEQGGRIPGIVLKIETAQAFVNLPELLLAAMRGSGVGVMIARGDLAIECGWERLAELQEEILWVCEAAHVPVIWATQVLEHLAKDGMPSRAEITDAAMGERAECVMLNKGLHIREALRVLDDIMCRMEGHQHKKRSMLRRLSLASHFSEKAGRAPELGVERNAPASSASAH